PPLPTRRSSDLSSKPSKTSSPTKASSSRQAKASSAPSNSIRPMPPNHQSVTFLSCSGGSSDSFFFSFSLFIFPFLSVLSVSSALILVRNLFPLLDFTLPCIFFSCDHLPSPWRNVP